MDDVVVAFFLAGTTVVAFFFTGTVVELAFFLGALLLWSSLVFEGFLIESLVQALVGDSWGVELVKSNVYNRQTL